MLPFLMKCCATCNITHHNYHNLPRKVIFFALDLLTQESSHPNLNLHHWHPGWAVDPKFTKMHYPPRKPNMFPKKISNWNKYIFQLH